jgi:hypothetical protein
MKKPLLALAFFAVAAAIAVSPFSPTNTPTAYAQGPVTPTSAFSRDLMKLTDAAAWRTGIGAGTPYSLPIAAVNTIGGVRVGTNLSIDGAGVLSAAGYTLPIASSGSLGGIRIGSGLTIDGSGIVSASGGGGGSSGWKASDGTSDPVYGQTIKTTGTAVMSTIQQPIATWTGATGNYFNSVDTRVDLTRLTGGVQWTEQINKVDFSPAPTPLNYVHSRGWNVPGSAYFGTDSHTLKETWEGCWAANAGANSTNPGISEIYCAFRKAGEPSTATTVRFNGWNIDNTTGFLFDQTFTSSRFDFSDQGPLAHTDPSFNPATRRNVYSYSFGGALWGDWASLERTAPGFVRLDASRVNGANANNQLDIYGNRVRFGHFKDNAAGPYYDVTENGHTVSGGVWGTTAGMLIDASANAYGVAGMIFTHGRAAGGVHLEMRNTAATSQFRVRGDASLEMAAINPSTATANTLGISTADNRLYYKDTANAVTYLSGPTSTSPAQITAARDDFNPGLGTFQRWSSDAARTVTGMVAGVDGEPREIWNVGSQNIVLANESASSSATNRFLTTSGADVTLTPNRCAIARYDSTTQRWRVSLLP